MDIQDKEEGISILAILSCRPCRCNLNLDLAIDNLISEIMREIDENVATPTIWCSSLVSMKNKALSPERTLDKTQKAKKQPFSFQKVGGRRRSRNPSYMPGLHIFRRDVRRKYGEMFMNVTNSHDINLFDRFIREFTTPGFRFDSSSPDDKKLRERYAVAMKNKKDLRTVINREEMIRSFALSFLTAPDSVLRLKTNQVHIREGTCGSKVVAEASIEAISLFYLVPDQTIETCCPPVQTMQTTASTPSTSGHPVEESRPDDLLLLPPPEEKHVYPLALFHYDSSPLSTSSRLVKLQTPRQKKLQVIFTMTLNEAHYIQRFQLTCWDFWEAPVTLLR